MLKPFLTTTLICLSLGTGLTFPANAFERTFDFEKDVPDNPPSGLILEGNPDNRPLFTVQKEPEKKNNVLALNGATFKSNVPLACLAWFSNLKNGSLSVDFLQTGTKDDIRKAGLVWRYQSIQEMYFLECDALKSVMRFGVYTNGRKKILEDERVKFPQGEWLKIGVEFKDDEMSFFFQGQPVFKAHDSKITGEGKVGIYLDSDIAVLFDNFKIQSSE